MAEPPAKAKAQEQEVLGPEAIRADEPIQKLVAQATRFEGPLPHPSIFKGYGEIVPDAPERILKQFEENSAFEREMSRDALKAQVAVDRRAQWMAFVLVLSGLMMGAWLVTQGHPWVASVLMGTLLVAVLVNYLRLSFHQKPESPPPKAQTSTNKPANKKRK